ncbi:MAG: radical SAM protein [Saccharofermentanales bacterium]
MDKEPADMEDLLKSCGLCPRMCRVDRTVGSRGYCRESDILVVARAALHQWEEPCISGEDGSGTVFFSGCNLQCVFCQNYSIAHGRTGKEISIGRLSEIFLELQEKKARNINLVTPTHYSPQIIQAVGMARRCGLHIPIVYNTGGYENVDALQRLEGVADIYLTDFKYKDAGLSGRYSHAADYFGIADRALREMVRQQPVPEFDGSGMMRRGVIVRHLMLPGCLEDSREVIRYLYDTYGNQIYISIMNQFTPMKQMRTDFPELDRKITEEEYGALVDFAVAIGVENGFIQEEGTSEESFIPEFDHEGV